MYRPRWARASSISDNTVMPTAMTSTSISCVNGPLSAVNGRPPGRPVVRGRSRSAVPGLDAATGGEIARALTSSEFQAKPFEMLRRRRSPIANWRARRVALIGAGRATTAAASSSRKLAAAAGLAARQKRVGRVAFVVRGRGDVAELAQAAAEGLTLAEFHGGSYKTAERRSAAGAAARLDGRRRRRRRRRWSGRDARSPAAAFSASAATSRASSRTSRATR